MALIRARTLVIQFVGETRGLQKSINDIGKQTTTMGKIEKAGKAAFTALALGAGAVAGGLAFSVKAFGDFESALNESFAIMGPLTDAMKNDMAAAARKVATETTFSAEEAASAFYYLASSGMDAAQSVAALPQVAQFAQAGMFDLETATDLLVNSQIALGLGSEDAATNLENLTRVSDVLTEANNQATGSVQEFAEALTNKAAGAMRQMNIDIEEGVAVLAAFAQRGVKGQVAGEKLAIFLRDTARAAVRNKEEFAKFNVEIFDSEGNMKNLADVVHEFEVALGPMSDAQRAATLENMGMTRSVGDIIRTLMGSSQEIRTFEAQLRNAGGATEEVANKQLQTFNAQMTLLKNQVMDIAIEIGSKLVPRLMPFVAWLRESLPGALEYLKEVWEGVRPTMENFANFIEDNVLPVLADLAGWFKDNPNAVIAFGAVVIGVLMLMATAFVGLKAIAVAQMAFIGAKMIWMGIVAMATGIKMAAAWIIGLGPIAWIVAAIVALGVIIFIFREQIMQWLGTAWEFIKGAAEAAINFIGDHWRQLLLIIGLPFALMTAFIITQWDHIRAFFVHVFHVMKEVVEDFWFFIQGVWNVITFLIVGALSAWKAIYSAAWNFIMDKTEGAREWIGEKIQWLRDKAVNAWNAVALWAGIVWGNIKDTVGGVIEWIGDRIDSAIGWVGDLIDKIGDIPGAGVVGDVVGFFSGGQSGMVVPKYAMGGISGDTVPAMLKPGEMVLNRRQQTSLFNSLNRGGWSGEGGGDTYVVEIYNPIGSEEEFTRMVVNAIKRAGGTGRPITIRGRQL